MLSVLALAGISVAVVITSFISGILGMAGGMILMGVLLALMPVPAAMMLHGTTQMAANGWRAWLWRNEIEWRVLRGTVYGSLAVLAIFAVLQLVAPRPIVYLVLGLTPFVSYVLPEWLKLNVDRRGHPFLCGAVCTVLSLLAGISGPLLDVFFLPSKMNRRQVVATKAASQTIAHLLKIFYFGMLLSTSHGTIDWPFAVAMIGLAVVGTTLSRKILERMSDHDFRRWTRNTVTAVGTFYLCSGLWALARG